MRRQRGTGEAIAIWLGFRLASWAAAYLGWRQTGHALSAERWGARLWEMLVTPWIRWDGLLYLRIVRDGYRPDNGTTQFHPLYPMTARALYRLGVAPEVALLLVSGGAALGLALVVHHLVARTSDEPTATASLLTLFLWPLGWVLYAPYSESLFLLMAALTFLWSAERRWWAASLAASAAVLTRQQGIFLLIVLGIAYLRAEGGRLRAWLNRRALALTLPLLTMAAWITYRTYRLDHAAFDFSSPHAFIYSVLISPNAVKVVPTQRFLAPWHALRLAVEYLVSHWPATDLASDLTMAALTLLLMAATWRWMNTAYRLYSVTIAVVALSYFTGDAAGLLAPYMGLPRHLMLALPLFLMAGRLSAGERRLLWAVSTIAYGWFVLLFEAHAWVP